MPLTAETLLNLNSFRSGPDERGHFGLYGGRFVAETLMPLILDLEAAYAAAKNDPAFHAELENLNTHYAGRPSPLYYAERLTKHFGGAKIYLKREDLLHTGAHKINNATGQALLARRMRKQRVIAETGAGQHGVATATVCALFGLRCVIYMGAEDVRRQALNVFRMRLLGAEVVTVNAGTRTLKDAINEALRDWVTNVHDTYYLLGSALGPHPYPLMVREFQSVIGREAREQILAATGKLPRALIACVGGGSNAIGLFHPFIADERVRLIGVEAFRKVVVFYEKLTYGGSVQAVTRASMARFASQTCHAEISHLLALIMDLVPLIGLGVIKSRLTAIPALMVFLDLLLVLLQRAHRARVRRILT